MRKTVVAVALVVTGLGLAARGSGAVPVVRGPAAAGSSPAATASAGVCSYSSIQRHLYKKGVLTVATDSPAYSPWFENNTPSNGKGYESAVAYAVAKQLGFSRSQVKWTIEPFNSSYAPGPKTFDFDINEISYTTQRRPGRHLQRQLLRRATGTHRPQEEPDREAPHARPSFAPTSTATRSAPRAWRSSTTELRPTQQPQVFNNLERRQVGTPGGRIQALVVDTPTAQYISSSEIPNREWWASSRARASTTGLLFAKGDPLVGCVNMAIAKLTADGTLCQARSTSSSACTPPSRRSSRSRGPQGRTGCP